jgi:hypothetical protein
MKGKRVIHSSDATERADEATGAADVTAASHAAVSAWVARHGRPAPEWVAKKAAIDFYDDGLGIADWFGGETFGRDFMEWARGHMGQGHSLACAEGQLLAEVAAWAHRGYVAGRQHGVEAVSSWDMSAAQIEKPPKGLGQDDS